MVWWTGNTVRLGKRTRFQCKTYSGGITNKATVFIYSENKRAYLHTTRASFNGNGKKLPPKIHQNGTKN